MQEENLVAPEPLPEVPNEEPDLEYLPETAGVATTMSYMGQKMLAQLCQEGGVPLINFLHILCISHEILRWLAAIVAFFTWSQVCTL